MNRLKNVFFTSCLLGMITVLSACSPEVGSERWCKNMKDKPKGDWTLHETKDYSKHCLFK